jgi:hypothetical protein
LTFWLHLREEGGEWLEDAPPIASLQKRQGDVDFRRGGVLLWMNAKSDQTFAIGDWITTGADSRAEVALEGGRILELGEGSLVVLSQGSPGEGDGGELVLTLVRGTVEVKAPKPSTENRPSGKKSRSTIPKLTLKAGDKAIRLAANHSHVSVTKETGRLPVVNTSSPDIRVTTVPEKAPSRAKPLAEVADEPAAHPPIPPKMAEWSAVGMEARLAVATDELTLWTDDALDSPGLHLTLTVLAGADLPKDASWQPLLQLSPAVSGFGDPKTIVGDVRLDPQSLILPLAGYAPAEPPSGGLVRRELTILVRNGARITKDGQVKESFAATATRIRLRSTRDLLPPQLAVFWQADESTDAPVTGWLRQDDRLRVEASGSLSLRLTNTRDLREIWPVLAKHNRLSFSALDFSLSRRGINFVRNGAVVASLGDSLPQGRRLALELKRLIGADLVFLGRPAALLTTPKGKGRSIEQWLASRDDAAADDSHPADSRDVVIYNGASGDLIYSASRDFIQNESSARVYLEESAIAIFSEMVEILAIPAAGRLVH